MEKIKQQLNKYLKYLKCNNEGITGAILITIIEALLYIINNGSSGGGEDLTQLEERVDDLEAELEIGPLTLSNFFVTPSSAEVGATISSLVFNWDLNKNPDSLSIAPLVGALPTGSRTKTLSTTLTNDTTFVLTAIKSGTTKTSTTTVRFLNRMFYGTNANLSLTNNQILALSSTLASSRARTITLNGNGQYLYIAYPASFGDATFVMNGLVNTAWTKTVMNVVNSFGVTVSYNVYRSNTIQNASNIAVIVS